MPEGILKQIRLDQYTTLRVGGVAQYFVEVSHSDELVSVLGFAQQQTSVAPLILGGGSNVLIADDGYSGLVIRMSTRGVAVEATTDSTIRVTAQAGEPWDDFVAYTVSRGWSGLENLSGIPGTVGASPVQNINAYGASVADTITSVEVFDMKAGVKKTLSQKECRFGYRDSIFKHAEGKDYIVLSVTFHLQPAATINLSYRSSSQSIARYIADRQIEIPTVLDIRQAVLYARENIGMLEGQFRSAGSFFKNTIVSHKEFEKIDQIVSEQFSELGTKMSPWNWEFPSGDVKISSAFLMECSHIFLPIPFPLPAGCTI